MTDFDPAYFDLHPKPKPTPPETSYTRPDGTTFEVGQLVSYEDGSGLRISATITRMQIVGTQWGRVWIKPLTCLMGTKVPEVEVVFPALQPICG